MVLTYKKAAESDADLLIDIYNASFYEDYIHYGECPGYGKTKEQMESSIRASSKYIVSKDGIPVGVISFENKGNGSYHIGCLCVIPAYQRQGIGSQAFRYMLSACPDWKHITVATPSDKEKNLKFYTEKCGFSIAGKEMDGTVEVATLVMERNVPH